MLRSELSPVQKGIETKLLSKISPTEASELSPVQKGIETLVFCGDWEPKVRTEPRSKGD